MGRFCLNSFNYVPFKDVVITDEVYWLPRIKATFNVTLPAVLKQLKITGRWDVSTLKWQPGQPNPPHIFWDRWASFARSWPLLTGVVIRQSSLRRRVTRSSNIMAQSYEHMWSNKLPGSVLASGTMDTSTHTIPLSSQRIGSQI